jgi:hypothetical protein
MTVTKCDVSYKEHTAVFTPVFVSLHIIVCSNGCLVLSIAIIKKKKKSEQILTKFGIEDQH